MAKIQCPNSLPRCDEGCGYFSKAQGKCSVVVIADSLAGMANIQGALKRTMEPKSKKAKGE